MMQSEEDWSPRPLSAEEKPAAASAASPEEEGAPPKARARRKPRPTVRKTKTEQAAEPSTPAPKADTAEPAREKPAAKEAPAETPRPAREEPVARKKESAGAPAAAEEPSANNSESPEQQPEKPRSEAQGNFQNRKPSQPSQGGGHYQGGQNRSGQQGAFRGKKKKNKKSGRHGGGGGGDRPSGSAPQQAPVHRMADLPDPSRFQNIDELARESAEAATGEPLYLDGLFTVSLHELVEQATEMGIVLDAAPNRRLLIGRMLERAAEENRPIIDRGVLEITESGYGFITRSAHNYRVQAEDPYVAASFIRRFGLKKGHQIEAQVRPPEGQERCPSVVRIVQVMGRDPAEISDIVPFEDLVPYYPLQRILLEVPDQENGKDVSMRAVDLLTPIGFGQRGLIVAPPRTGKTVILQQIANSIATNNPQAHLIVLLIDERPEEVTDFRRHTKGEVVSSTFDEPASSHVAVAEMVIEKARRMVEAGEDVVILLDSITRLARAYNTMMPSSGKILSGGVESNALQKPKRFFGAARNIEDGGSLTILATALIDTGSRMDEVIFEEFKGTGNMELHLDRALVDKRIFPAINIEKSGTRKEELLYHPDELNRIYSLRRAIQGVPIVEAMEMLVQRLKKTRSNAEFLLAMNR